MNARRNPEVLIDAFLAEGVSDLPDRVFDAVRSDIHRTRQRVVIGPWREPHMLTPIRLSIAAAIVLIGGGIAWSQLGALPAGPGDQTTPSPTAAPSPTGAASRTAVPSPGPQLIGGATHLLDPGRYRIDYATVPGATGPGPTIDFTITAAGWTNFANFAADRNYDDGASVGPSFVVWNITNVSKDPCTDHTPRVPPPGDGIDALLEALGEQVGIEAGPLTPVTIDGYAGKYVELTITADITDCEGGFFTWGSDREGRFAQATGEVDRVYALDVEGRRVTFFTRVLRDSAPDHVGQLRRLVESIDIQP
jgi:hypothetical protein